MHYTAPGKLFISGEWAILEKGNFGLVAAVNHRVHVTIEKSDRLAVSAPEFNVADAEAAYGDGKITFDADEEKKKTLALLGEAMAVSLRFIDENGIQKKLFKITTSSAEAQITIDSQPRKVGFGSSAAVVVAAIAAIIDFHGYNAKKEEIYKLAAIAHYYAQGKAGSAFDVAASTFGGVFVYSRFDPGWLTKKIETGTPLSRIISEKWPGLVIEKMEVPEKFGMLVGWTKTSASTSTMIKQMNEFKSKHPDKYAKHFGSIASCAKKAIDAFKKNDEKTLLYLLNENEKLLAKLGEESGVNIETAELKRLAELAEKEGGAGKLSGAGGGDCGIAVCFDDQTEHNIRRVWEREGIVVIDASLDKEGVRREDW